MILLNNDHVRALLTVPECIEVLKSAYRELGIGEAALRDRADLVSPGVKDDTMYILKSMEGLIPNAGVSCVRITSDMHHFYEVNGQLRRSKLPAAPGDRYTGLGVLLSTETTEPLMMFTDGAINPSRVAATTALGIKYLARENSKTIALLGCGKQADKQIPAVAAVRNVDIIKCYSLTGQNRTKFARETSEKYGVNVVDVNTPEEAVEVGYFDRVVAGEELMSTALAEAKRLAKLPVRAYGYTKRVMRKRTIDYIRETLISDLQGFTP